MSLYGNADAAFLQGSLGAIFDEARANGGAVLRGRPEDGCLLVDQLSEVLGPVVVAPIGTPFGELGVGEGHRLVMVIDDSDNYFIVYRGDGERADILVEERSDPDGMAPAHLILGDPEALHYLGHDAVEEQYGGILAYRPAGGAGDVEGDIPVDAAVCHVVDNKTKRRNIQCLVTVALNNKNILFADLNVVSEVNRKCSITA